MGHLRTSPTFARTRSPPTRRCSTSGSSPTSAASASARSPARRSTPTARASASTAPALRRSTARSASSRASSTAPSSGAGSPGILSSASAASPTPAPRRSTPARRRPSRRSAPSSTRATPRSSASSPTRACAPARPTRSSGATCSTTAAARASGCASTARSPARRSRPRSPARREPELFTPVARELVELHLARGRPDPSALVFPDSEGGHLRRQNWRRRVWIPALERAGVAYFRSYDLRHTCATLLLYEGRTLNEVAEHLGTPIPASPPAPTRTSCATPRDAPRPDHVRRSERPSRRFP